MLQLTCNQLDQLKCNHCLSLLNQSKDTWFQAIVRKNTGSWNWCFLTCTRRTGSETQGISRVCIISEQACLTLPAADGLHPCRALGKGTTVLDHGSCYKGGQGEDLWTVEVFSQFLAILLPVFNNSSPRFLLFACARHLPLSRQSLQSITCFLACIFSTALSLLCLLSFLWSSTKEWQNNLIPSWWYQRFLLALCVLLFPSAPHFSLQTTEMKSIYSCQLHGVLLLIVLSKPCVFQNLSVVQEQRYLLLPMSVYEWFLKWQQPQTSKSLVLFFLHYKP